MKFIAIGYPDEENAYHGHHTTREEWCFEAPSKEVLLDSKYINDIVAKKYNCKKD